MIVKVQITVEKERTTIQIQKFLKIRMKMERKRNKMRKKAKKIFNSKTYLRTLRKTLRINNVEYPKKCSKELTKK